MKVTCPVCGGAKFVDDLDLIQTDLQYARGFLWNPPGYPYGGFPQLACNECKGQGWVDTSGYPGGLFTLHLDATGYWVMVAMVSSPVFEGHFWKDPSGFAVIRTDLNQGYFPTVRSDFITLN